MATYYIRTRGNDSNAGTSAGAAWLTLSKALGVTGISSGDTVYIGAGTYRTSGFSVVMTSATAETFIIGDYDGTKTGDAGEVVISHFANGDYGAADNTSGYVISMTSKDFLTFQRLTVAIGDGRGFSMNSCEDIKFYKCEFISCFYTSEPIYFGNSVNEVANVTIDSCAFFALGGPICSININSYGSSTAALDLNFVIKNCLFWGGSEANQARPYFIQMGGNFGATHKPGGVDILNCTFWGTAANGIRTLSNWSTTYPTTVYGCIIHCEATAIYGHATGTIVEDFNLIMAGTARANTAVGVNTYVEDTQENLVPLFHFGQELIVSRRKTMPFLMPKFGCFVNIGSHASSPTIDILGVSRPSGNCIVVSTGTATAGAALTLTDSGKTWGIDEFVDHTVKIESGTGSGQTKRINSNTATVLTVDGNWKTNPSTDSVYTIYGGSVWSTTGSVVAATSTTLTDTNAVWPSYHWKGFVVTIDSGTGSGQTRYISTNTATLLTITVAWTTNPDATSTYSIFKDPTSSINGVVPAVGCYEVGECGFMATNVVRTGSNSLRISGPGYVDFIAPVAAESSLVSVYVQWDSAYSGTKPSIAVLNGTECGVADAVTYATGGSGSWEKISVSFTPTADGQVTIRVQSYSSIARSNTYFDDINT